MTFHQFLKLIISRWWIIASVTVIAVVCTGFFTIYYIHPLYSNTTTLLVNDRNDDSKLALKFDDILLYEKLLGTYKQIITSNFILSPSIEVLSGDYGINKTVESIRSNLQVTTSSNSQIISLTVTDPDHRTASTIANTIAATFQGRLPSIMNVNNIQIIDRAEIKANPRPISPHVKLNLVISFFLGLTSSVSVILLIHLMDTHIRLEEDLAGMMPVPILGVVPRGPTRKRSRRKGRIG